MNKNSIIIFAIATLMFCGMATTSTASDVDVRLSTREAYVGMPIVLQIAINNAEQYQQPSIPAIDGCDIRSAGAPSQNSQITIINGRRSASRSVTMRYLITPRRAGTYEIPSFTVNVDGRDVKTKPLRFVATKSDTGDLMFVEIEGGTDRVFVGQPLKLTLKIWIKPYRDREKNIVLDEANMWQMISQQTSWGSFSDRIQELAESNRRPGGREVLRDDGSGNERGYYQYEIEATVYPKRPGKIDADDVQIVVNYPTGLGKSRDPFDSFFKDSGFGGNSALSRMMDDDFFSSPFRNRLSVTSARPIVAEANVDETEVLPVPMEGRPDDYRGAVGRYKIVTQAANTHVSAGDPINLNIGIAGTGPMELVQAPPLATLPSLTADFKVNDEPLAGFVQDDTKVFSTSIRPRKEGITQIPPIPFSFFNPDTESFETVMSEPISITVDKSESLALDAIVGNARRKDAGQNDDGDTANQPSPEFSNSNSPTLLESHAARSASGWVWPFVVFPPIIWLSTLIVRKREAIANRLPSFKSENARCLTAIDQAADKTQIVNGLVRYIGQRSGHACSEADNAVGNLRTCGMPSIATDVERFFFQCEREHASDNPEFILRARHSARELLQRLETAFSASKKSLVKRPTLSDRQNRPKRSSLRHVNATARRASMLLLALIAVSCLSNDSAIASDEPTETAVTRPAIELLSKQQQETILQEAGEAYAKATKLSKTDAVEAKELYLNAAINYQLLVDSGISNSQLYFNLGNAYLNGNELGYAIVNYERARILDPGNNQLALNLDFANSLVKRNQNNDARDTGSLFSLSRAHYGNQIVVETVGAQTISWILIVSSLLFWGILIVRAWGYQFSTWRFAVAPLIVLALSITSYGLSLSANSSSKSVNGIIVAKKMTMHEADGEQFGVIQTLESAQGSRVDVLAERGGWRQIQTDGGDKGWVQEKEVEFLAR